MCSSSLNLPAALIIMDGFGLADASAGNAISLANTPNLDALFGNYPFLAIQASGNAVGLPQPQMGNSEVGHLNIGAGRVVHQELTRIDNACADGTIAENPVINAAFDSAIAKRGVVHFFGLLSDGGVHSSNEHLYALLGHAASYGVRDAYVHCFLDGRDVPPTSALDYLLQLQERLEVLNTTSFSCKIASVSGRYFAMDRDNRWDRVEKAYRAIACCEPLSQIDPISYVQGSYDEGVTDEFVAPASFVQRGVQDADSVIFFNFRPDRARELTHCFTDREPFAEAPAIRPHFVCLTEYDPFIPASVAFEKSFPENVLADVLASAGLTQYHIAETEKYAHVTFFLNGGREKEKPGEKRVLIPSPKVATYDLQPEMSAFEVARTLADAIDADEADVYIVNFANCDMVGHTGSIPATVKAVEAVDACVGLVVDALERKGGVGILTADHGNADAMLAPDGSPHTAHTLNLVPMVLLDCSGSNFTFKPGASGALCNLSPTLLEMIGLPIPDDMTAESLLA